MPPGRRLAPATSLRHLAALGFIAVLATCTDNPSGPAHGFLGRGYVALRPILVAPVSLASFDLTIDTLRVIVIRPATDTLADTSAYFPPNESSLGLAIPVLLNAAVETLLVHFELKAGAQVLFTGSDSAVVKLGVPDSATTATVPLKYVGPGAGITKITVAPQDSVVTLAGTEKFRVTAESSGVAVDSFYVSWSTSDTAVAKVNAFGLLQAPNARGSVYLRVVTPNGVRDSTRVTFVPVPVALNLVSGSGQSGVVNTTLAQPLRVQVKGSDSLGVKGIAVHFAATAGGGSVKDSVVVTDSLGFAADSATLGPLAVPQTFQASAAGLTTVNASATALAGPISPTKSVITVSSGTLVSGTNTTVTLQGKDAGGNALTIGGATVLFSASTGGGVSTGTLGAVTDNGNGSYTASFTGVLVGTPTTIGGTINGVSVTTALPTVTVTPGAIATTTSLVTVDSATLASGHVATLRLTAKDAAGNALTSGGATVVFSDSGGTSTGTIGSTTDNGNGTYQASFTGVVAGTATSIKATINASTVATARPAIAVLPGAVSAATSVVTVDSGSLASGHITTLRLQAKDAAGNNRTTGGDVVVFTDSGGTSTGTIGSTTDNANGTYSATFTGVVAGTATSIKATVNAVTVTTVRPTIAVLPGLASTAISAITVDSTSLASGHVATLKLQAKDAAGNNLTTGGATVVFTDSGGTSTGTIGAATDNGNGTYTAGFTGVLAGTATTIHATFNGTALTSALPAITVGPGAASTVQSLVTVTSGTVASGALTTLQLQAKDAAGNSLTAGGLAIVFTNSGGTSTGTISATTDHGNGTYSATFTGLVAGTATTIHATIGGNPVTSALPTVSVVPGNAVTAQSIVSVSTGTVLSGGTATLTLQAKDSVGNNLTSGGLTVAFTHAGGTSTGTISATTDNNNGTYTATFTATIAGTATTIGATIGGQPVTSTLPTVTVTAGAISAATSVITVQSATILSGATDTLLLQAKDAAGNNVTTGGATVVFTNSGGTSTGSIGAAADHGNGTYTAPFSGLVAGTATTIGATINAVAVTTALPTITVNPGATATVTVTPAVDTLVALGRTKGFTASAKDANGNAVASETFTWSSSNLGIATVNAATGVATAIGPGTATITATSSNSKTGTAAVTIAQVVKTVVVTPAVDTAHAIGDSVLFTAVAKDSSDSIVTGQTFTWSSSNLSLATVSAVGLAHALAVGTVTITATHGTVSGTASFTIAQRVATVTVSPDTVTVIVGATPTFTAVAKDSNANPVTGATFVWASTNTGIATIIPATGVATAIGTGVDTITATSGGVIGRATLTVSAAVHTTDITTNTTWALAQSPHRVSGFLRILNNATLTIQAGVTVKFDTLSGLQVGDTGLNQAGGLVMDGTTAPITLTANTASPIPGFWKRLEVQRSLAVSPWRKVLLQWSGAANGPCILIADRLGAALDLDSLHLRQCQGAGLQLSDGAVHLHRSEVDSTGARGTHTINGTIEVDSTTFRGVGTGINFANPVAHFGPSSANRFLGDGTPIQLNAFQLPGLQAQDTIDNNTSNAIVVNGGQPDPAAATLTLFRQPRPRPSGFDYHVTSAGGLLDVGRSGGQELVLDSAVAIGFDAGAGIRIGDSSGTRSGTLRSLGTSAANQPILDGFTASVPGSWVGVEIGRLAAADTVRFVRIQSAGDSVPGYTNHRLGLLVRNPVAVPLLLDHLQVYGNGLATDPTNSGGIGFTANGGGVEVRLSDVATNQGYGLVVPDRSFYIHGNTFNANVIGIGSFTQGGTQLVAGDSLVANAYSAHKYALSLSAAALRALYDTVLPAQNTDTLLLTGGMLTANARLPLVPGFVWRVSGPVVVDSNATFAITPGNTVAFDTVSTFIPPPNQGIGPPPPPNGFGSGGTIVIGSSRPAALSIPGTAAAPVLLTASAATGHWGGIQWAWPQGALDVTNNVFTYVTVDRAGYTLPCLIDCLPTQVGALRFTDTTGVILTLDHVIVRNGGSYALDVERAFGATNVTASQFYNNGATTFQVGRGAGFTISGSDIYNYRGVGIAGPTGTDTLNATNNWWGDVAGPDSGYSFSDPLGRAAFNFAAVRYVPFVTSGPIFPVGPAAALRPATDTVLASGDTVVSIVGLPDSLRVRVVDAEGRGVGSGAPAVNWTTNSGTVLPAGGPPDAGGRSGTSWVTGTVAGQWATTATAIGGPVRFPISLLPGNTIPTTVDWTVLASRTVAESIYAHPGLGTDTVVYLSSNHVSAIVTHARDLHGNVTQPNVGPLFDQGPCTGGVCRFPAADSIRGDTIYFRPPVVSETANYVITGEYENGLGGSDQVVLKVKPVAVGVRIDRDVVTAGLQDTGSVAFNSLCRVGGPVNSYCARRFDAFVVDSGGAPIINSQASFGWIHPAVPDTTVTLDSIRGPALDNAYLSAHANGPTWLVAVDSNDVSPTFLKRDSMLITVAQLPVSINVTPNSVNLRVGDTTTFAAVSFDQGGDTVRAAAVHWREVEVPAHLTFTDTSVVNHVTVRVDSTPVGGQDAVDAFFVRAPGDTVFGSGNIASPALLRVTVGSAPDGIGVDATSNRVYVANGNDGTLSVINSATDAVATTISVGIGANQVGVDPGLNRTYVTTDSVGASLAIVDGSTGTLVKTLDLGASIAPQGVAVDEFSHQIYVAAMNPTPFLYHIDATLGDQIVDSIPLPSQGFGVAFNPVNAMVYVAHFNDSTVSVVNPATHSIVQTITVGLNPLDVAVDPAMNLVYVSTQNGGGSGGVAVIQASTGIETGFVPVFAAYGLAVDPNLHRVYVGTSYAFGGLTYFDNGLSGLQPTQNLYIAQSSNDNPQRVAYNGANGKVYTVHLSFNHVTRLAF